MKVFFVLVFVLVFVVLLSRPGANAPLLDPSRHVVYETVPAEEKQIRLRRLLRRQGPRQGRQEQRPRGNNDRPWDGQLQQGLIGQPGQPQQSPGQLQQQRPQGNYRPIVLRPQQPWDGQLGNYNNVMMTRQPNSVWDVATRNPDHFSIFVDLARNAGLAGTLQSLHGITLFLPTNRAFRVLPEPTFRNLNNRDHLRLLTSILEYHIYLGGVLLEQDFPVEGIERLTMSNGQPTELQRNAERGGQWELNTALLQQTDIRTGQGDVVHVIDKVLLRHNKEIHCAHMVVCPDQGH